MSLYKPRWKQYQAYKLLDFREEEDYYGKVGFFKISCGLMDGMSIANAFRRNLMIKSAGYAAVAYKIVGADSPFDNVVGLSLPVNLIVDNISRIQFYLNDNQEFVISNVNLNKYTGSITAGMFANDSVIVSNPDLELCYVSGVNVDISIGIGVGYGYVSEVEQRQYFEITDDWFVKDALFNPVRRVSYNCTSQGSEDIIEMKVYADSNCNMMSLFNGAKRDLSYMFGVADDLEVEPDNANDDLQCEQFLGIDVDSCNELSVRTRNALKFGGVNDLRLLLSFSPSVLISKVAGIGHRSIEDIGNFLTKYVTDAQFASLKRYCDDKVVRNIELYLQSAKAAPTDDGVYYEEEEDE